MHELGDCRARIVPQERSDQGHTFCPGASRGFLTRYKKTKK
jgi:hypothetical protein